MQPKPIADTSRPLFPSSRFFILKSLRNAGTQKIKSRDTRQTHSYFHAFLRYSINSLLLVTRHRSLVTFDPHSDLRDAMSMEKRFFPSDLSSLSYASLTF